MMRTSPNVNARQVAALIWNMANSSDLRCLEQLVPNAAQDGTVQEWDSLGRSPATACWNLPNS
jgi:hypothetical protein